MTFLREILTGVGALLRGFGMVLRRPKLFFLGALPPLITSILFLVVLVALLARIDDIVAWMTPFADGWAEGWATTLRVVVGIALVAASVLLMVIGFTTITLALGSPLYDKIAEEVEEELGDAPEAPDEPLLPSLTRALRQSVTLILISVATAIPLFVAGFIPFVGQTVVPAVSALVGGWLLGAELVGAAFERRGLQRLRDRFAGLRRRRLRSLGFAVPSFLLLSIPFVAVLVFPAATAGGTILARGLVPPPPRPDHPNHPGHPGY
ncbi:EI24 domain-containing protein [Thermobifida halotolerans]|uniref:EI24 domain-containing protein n=1 Tax=Thermobifida halotolerans TaxID=483545 RepID=A0AA97LX44_9ACTN|nr:EI24 domain-containing protein [Thermobifida halotolerans]UOE19714.1 EI24 domain-containing protein [Thermobifida halotolerans]